MTDALLNTLTILQSAGLSEADQQTRSQYAIDTWCDQQTDIAAAIRALDAACHPLLSQVIKDHGKNRLLDAIAGPSSTATSGTTNQSSTGTGDVTTWPSAGQIIAGRYQLEGQGFSGGMGRVYKAKDLEESNDSVTIYKALKFLNPQLQNDPVQHKRFQQEAYNTRALNHDHIISVYSFGEADIWFYIVMEWLQGQSLRHVQAHYDNERIPWRQLRQWLPPIASALHYAHNRRFSYHTDNGKKVAVNGIIHRDIKPANIYLDQDDRIVILDFGIARVVKDTLTSRGIERNNTSGSLEYMPPEAFIDQVAQPQYDIYSLAVTLYELLTGNTPFRAEIANIRTANSHPMPQKPAELSEAEWQVLQQGLHADPAERVPGYWEPKAQRQLVAKHWVETLLNAQAQYEKQRAELEAAAEHEAKRQVEEAAIKAAQEAEEVKRLAALKAKGEAKRQAALAAQKAAREAEIKAQEEAKKAARREPGDTFQDGPNLPEMVVVPAGEFMMGSPAHEPKRRGSEGPQHKVTIAKPFAVGKYPVTWAEWEACVAAKGCDPQGPQKAGGAGALGKGRRPVINVNWHDAKAYIAWLNKTTGKTYRLLTEAEWEYAARAGTTTPFSTGKTITTDQASFIPEVTWFGKKKGVDRPKTVPVGSFAANAFGLHDMHGNVWEWVEDCWHDNYENAPTDGSAWLKANGGDCNRRVLRGGSCGDFPNRLRSAIRSWNSASTRYYNGGFRLARDI